MAAGEIIKAFIYGLCDEHGVIRYVGQTRLTLRERLRRHVSVARCTNNTNHRCNWIRSCISRGYIPVIKELQSVEGTQWEVNEAEILWISKLKSASSKSLTNGSHGGEGGSLSMHVRIKIGRGNRGKYRPPELRNRLSESLKAWHRSHSISEETRKKIGESSRARRWKPEDRAKLLEAWNKRRAIYGPSGRAA